MSEMAGRALITGSSGGIGRAIALRLAREGWSVGIHYAHNACAAEAAAREAETLGVRAEVFKADAARIPEMQAMVSDFVSRMGGLELLVNNVGQTVCRPFLETDEALFDELVAMNLKAHYFTAQSAAREMIARGTAGQILNITSIQQQTCFPEASVYGSVKAAFAKLTQHLCVELAPYGIRVNAVAPGSIQTSAAPAPERAAYLASRAPMGRLGTPEEVAAAVAFLASEEAAYVNGANLLVDGGMMAPSYVDNLYTPRVVTDKLR